MGVSLVVQPGRRPVLPPIGGPRGFVPPRGRRGSLPKQLLLVILFAVLLASGGTVATVAALPQSPPKPPVMACAPAAAGGKLTAEQRQNATRIIAVGRSMGVPERGLVVGLATAMQESRLRNLGGRGIAEDGGDRDSAGLFQQRPSQGWGSYGQVTNPEYAARTFFDRLQKLRGYERMRVTAAAQAIQRSGYPDAYAKWEPAAQALVSGTTCEKR